MIFPWNKKKKEELKEELKKKKKYMEKQTKEYIAKIESRETEKGKNIFKIKKEGKIWNVYLSDVSGGTIEPSILFSGTLKEARKFIDRQF